MENERSEDDEMYGGVWKAVEIKVGETGIVETKEGREKIKRRKKARGEEVEEREIKEEEKAKK